MEQTTKGPIDVRRQAEDDLVRLAVLMAGGQDNTEEADRLRDSISILERRLDPEDVQALRRLSSDLYMLEDDEIYDNAGPAYSTWQQVKAALVERHAVHDWHGMLVLLRQEAPEMPMVVRAWLRARAYEELRSYAAAWAFYDYAARIDPEQPTYSYAALFCLRKWDNDEAKRRSDYLIADLDANAALRLLSALTIISYYPQARPPEDEIRNVAMNLIPALGSAANDPNVTRDVLNGGYAGLAACLEMLGDYKSAIDVYRIAASDGAIPPLMCVHELQRLVSQSVPSGIVIDPASLINNLEDREESFEDRATASVMQLLVSQI